MVQRGKVSMDAQNFKLDRSLNKNIESLRTVFNNDDTVIFREFENKNSPSLRFCAITVNGMVNKQIIDEYVIEPLMRIDLNTIKIKENITSKNIVEILLKKVITNVDVKKTSDLEAAVADMLYGDTLIIIDGVTELLIADTKGWSMRAIEQSTSERVIRGPKEAFNESIITNLSLVRRRLRNKDLKFEFNEIGVRTKTKVCICYVEGVANDKILKELKIRLSKIDFDGILYDETIEEFIKDSPMSIFKTIGSTERPDVVSARLLEGRIAVFCDGTPFVLTLPYIFVEYFQSVDDYSINYMFGTFNRLLRYLGFFLAVSVPSLYVAVTTFHQELMPTSLLLSISNARTGVPLPTVVECFVLLLGFEVLRESGVRIQQPIGQAVSIVGALIIGDASVTARLISAPMVVVVAATVLSSFLIPKMKAALIILRFLFLILGGFIGLYGYMFGITGLFIYLMSVRSFGVPYTMGVGLVKPEMLKDTAIRVPWWDMRKRPRFISNENKRNGSSN